MTDNEIDWEAIEDLITEIYFEELDNDCPLGYTNCRCIKPCFLKEKS